NVRAMPEGLTAPELWLLGSSDTSAAYAAQLGWAFSFAQFISPEGGEGVIRAYKRQFHASPALAAPRASIGVAVVCAETEREAERLAWSRWGWRVMAGGGARGIPSPEEAMSYPYNASERQYLEYQRGRSIYGDPLQVKTRLLSLGEQYDVDEFVVVTITH